MNRKSELQELRRSNFAKAKKLRGLYKETFQKLYKELLVDVQKGIELENVISDLIDMLLNAMNERKPVAELFSDGYDTFYRELLDSLPVFSQESKQIRRINRKRKNVFLGTVLCLLIISVILWQIGYIGIWTEGIAYSAGSLDKYNYHFSLLQEDYSVDINLVDLDSNKGKVLFDDGSCKIDVYKVDKMTANGGGYRIHFRSHGKYSLKEAKLVSGIKHTTTEERWFMYDMKAKIKTEYKGISYDGEVMGQSGLNYKDGDFFSFYLFPYELYDDGTISLDKPDDNIVKVTVSNLCENFWYRK